MARCPTLSLLVLLVPSVGAAQELLEPAARQGYYLAVGVRNGGMTIVDSRLGGLGFMQGGAFTLRFGQMAGEPFGFGLAFVFGGGANDDWGGGYGALLLDAQYHPMDNLALRAGIGVGGLGVGRSKEELKQEDDPTGSAGTLYSLGMSYDWFPWWERADKSGGLAFTPFFEGQLLPGDGLVAFGFFLGIEVSYWFGLPDNKLRLEESEAFVRDD